MKKPSAASRLANFLGTLSAIESFDGKIAVSVTTTKPWSKESPKQLSSRLTEALNEELLALETTWYEEHYPLPHQQDSDCAIDRRTNCCRVCGVDHGGKCQQCGGRGFHKPDCQALIS